MIPILAVFIFRFPAEWLAPVVAPLQFDTPENLVAAMAAFISVLLAALAFTVRAYIAQRDKFDAFVIAMFEKNLTSQQENKEAIADNTELVKIIAEELRVRKRSENRGRNTKTS